MTHPRDRRGVTPLALGEHVVLALLAEEPQHGWAIVRTLAPEGEIGRIWTLSRPLAYRALDMLGEHDLVRVARTESGDGPRRTILAANARGRREVDRWLQTPVTHLRDVRTELLLKLVFSERAGRDARPLLVAQQDVFAPIFAGLDRAARRTGADIVDRWRRENAEAARRFLAGALRAEPREPG
jgi:PadR family transcriptional regulator AphA